MRDFSVFIPVLNEEAILAPNLEALLAFLDGLSANYEVLIGSNGSSDRTEEIGRGLAAAHQRVRFFHLAEKGPGRAFRQAVRMADSPHLVTLDMDLSTDLDFVPRALGLLADHAVVVGSKRQGVQERTLTRILGSGAYIACAGLFLGLPFQDYSIGAKAFQREVALRFLAAVDHHTAYVGNIIYEAHRAGLPIIEVPVTCKDIRRSRFNLGHEGLYRFAWLFRIFLTARLLGRPVRAPGLP